MKKIKTNFKLLIVLAVMLLANCIFNTNTVNATDVQNLLDMIPNTIQVDIPEIEYENAEIAVKEKVKQIWEENNVSNVEQINFDVNYTGKYVAGYFYSGINILIESVSKEISIEYNNTKNKNSTDEAYIKGLKIQSPKYYEVGLDFIDNTEKNFEKIVQDYYNTVITDSSITAKVSIGASGTDGGLNCWSYEVGTTLLLFKDEILYDMRAMGQECTIPVINVPNNIDINQVNDYIIELVEEKYNQFNGKIVSINEGTKNGIGIEIPSGYTLYTNDILPTSYFIIKREIKAINETTGIKLETNTKVIPEDTVLEAKEIEKESANFVLIEETLKNEAEKFVAYDINLKSEGVKIQPNGKVKISLPIPEGYDTSKLLIYRIAEDGTKTKYDVIVETIEGKKYATFETDHFSTYILAEEKTITNNLDASNDNDVDNENVENNKDETPKTGNNVNTIEIILISLFIIGVMIIKNSKKIRKSI